jgi:hypothetical protein
MKISVFSTKKYYSGDNFKKRGVLEIYMTLVFFIAAEKSLDFNFSSFQMGIKLLP